MLENEGVALRAIRWSEICPWLSIVKCIRLAVGFRLLILGGLAAFLTLLGWWTIASVFSHDGVANASWTKVFAERSAWGVIDESVPNKPFSFDSYFIRYWAGGLDIGDKGPMIRVWGLLIEPVWRFLRLPLDQSLTPGDFCSLLLTAIWSLAVWAFFGAAISRVAAVQLASGEQVGWAAAMRWAGAKWAAYLAAPVLPMVAVGLVVVPIWLLGLLMKANFFAFLAGLIWPLVLIGGFVMTVLLAGVLLGWPLMWATISVEGTDSFDALNRTYAYVFQRPLRYLFYIVVAAVIGWLGWIVVEEFAAAVIWLAAWAASWGAGGLRLESLMARTDDSSLAHAAAALIVFWNGWVKLLAIGYAFSYFAVASTAIYYLLRRDVDARETDEVFLDADGSEQKFGLPRLQKDAAGAPEIVESTAVGTESGNDKEPSAKTSQ